MKRRLLGFFLFFLASILLAACQRERVFEVQNFRFEEGWRGCPVEAENCSYLKLAYPRLEGGETKAREAIQNDIVGFALNSEADGLPAKDAPAAAQAFFASYQQFSQQNPKAPQVWWQRREVEVLANTSRVLSLSMVNAEYMGGAHPNETRDLRSYDPQTGRRYQLSDWLKPGFGPALNAAGEKVFREVRKVAPGTDLNDAGFTFENGFQLNDNFAATPKGLAFYFNAYEVASYADGPTELIIPYSEIRAWMLSGGPLDSLAKR